MTAQHIEIAGQPMVLLTRREFERLTDAAENYGDICAAVAAQSRREAGEEYLPEEAVDRLLAGDSPLRVWRQHRGLTLEALANKVGCGSSMISKLEKGRNEGGIRLWKALAEALEVSVDDLLPPD